MAKEHVGQFLHGLEPLPAQLIDPAVQVAQHRAFIAIGPEPVQTLFQQVGLHDSAVQGKQLVELLLLMRGQMQPARQQQPTFALDQFPRRSAFTEELGSADLVDRRIGVLHDVEFVIDDAAVGQPLRDALLERFPHVDAGGPHGAALKGAQMLLKELIECLLLALGAEPERLATRRARW